MKEIVSELKAEKGLLNGEKGEDKYGESPWNPTKELMGERKMDQGQRPWERAEHMRKRREKKTVATQGEGGRQVELFSEGRSSACDGKERHPRSKAANHRQIKTLGKTSTKGEKHFREKRREKSWDHGSNR